MSCAGGYAVGVGGDDGRPRRPDLPPDDPRREGEPRAARPGQDDDWAAKPGITNLLEILSLFSETPVEKLVDEHHAKQYGEFKKLVAEAVVDGLASVRSAYAALEDEEVSRLMNKGALDARSSAEKFQVSVREKVGLTGH